MGDKMCAIPRHRYPTRWILGRHTSSLYLAPGVEDTAEDKVLAPCKRKKVEKHNFYLPREIIFKILIFIPANVLHEVVKYVCKQWYDIVSDPHFVKVHCSLSSGGGFLIQDAKEMFQAYNIEACGARLNVTEIRFPSPAKLLGSFNGLVLLLHVTKPDILHVMNLVTKRKISLPPLTGLKEYTGFALNSSGHYKVVHVSGETDSFEVEMRILTVGVDKACRFVNVHGIFLAREDLFLLPHEERLRKVLVKIALLHRPYFIAGFIYWYCTVSFFGFALDVNTEIIYRFYRPTRDIFKGCRPVRFLSMGTCLGLLKLEEGLWRLWKLTDVKTSEWTEVAGIDMQPVLDRIDKMFYPSKCCYFWPVLLTDEDFWFYRGIDKEFIVVRYNLADESFVFFPIKTVVQSTLFIPFVHTLLSPKELLA